MASRVAEFICQGRPEVLTDWMDASVIDENDPVATDESLNPFNPDNGPPYSAEFIARYRAAQRARNQRARANNGSNPERASQYAGGRSRAASGAPPVWARASSGDGTPSSLSHARAWPGSGRWW